MFKLKVEGEGYIVFFIKVNMISKRILADSQNSIPLHSKIIDCLNLMDVEFIIIA